MKFFSQQTGDLEFRLLPVSSEEEDLLHKLKALDQLPALKNIEKFEERVMYGRQHPSARKAEELGLSTSQLLFPIPEEATEMPMDVYHFGQRMRALSSLSTRIRVLEKMEKEVMANSRARKLKSTLSASEKSSTGLGGWRKVMRLKKL